LPFEFTVLELARVRLAAFDDRHVDGLFTLYSDPRTMRYLVRPVLTERKGAEEMLARARTGMAENTSLQLAIERIADGAFLGSCLLFNFNKDSRRAEIGYSLVPGHWSQGYIAESLPALIDYGFGPLGLNRLEADIDPDNAASKRVLERHGFRYEGLLRERWIVRGAASDSAMYGLLQREWRAPRVE
jgi:ribosomal-protein-alanine N-acetyltransferase